MMGIIERKTQF